MKKNIHLITFIAITIFVLFGTAGRIRAGELPYHAFLMDLHSLKERLMGNRLMVKDDTTVTRAYEDTLVVGYEADTEEILDGRADAVRDLCAYAGERGIDFLYAAIPGKHAQFNLPPNVAHEARGNYERFVVKMQERGIPVLVVDDILNAAYPDIKDAYFITDHHWRPEAGIIVAGELVRELHERFGMDYDPFYLDPDNYSYMVMEDMFLGSYGKKTGAWFTEGSPDDFTLIRPEFETRCTEEQPLRGTMRQGAYEEVFLFPERLEGPMYDTNPYAYYSGGDFRIQIMRNEDNKDGARILLVRDSYSCVTAPYLALECSELHIVDMREVDFIEGERIDLYPYIDQVDPDILIVMYANTADEGMFEWHGGK